MKPRNFYFFYVLFALFVAWTAYGAFPLVCFEEDGSNVILGVQQMLNRGWSVSPHLNYCYAAQPLVYYVIGAFALLSGLTCEQSYCLLTLVFAIVFAWQIIAFVHRLTGLRREYIIGALFLLPESYAIASYPNSAIFAAVFFMWGLDMLLRHRYWFATLLLGLAPLFRNDVLSAYPVVLPLMFFMGYDMKRSLTKTAVIAIAVIIIFMSGQWMLRLEDAEVSSIKYTIQTYLFWSGYISLFSHFKALLGFYTVMSLILIPWGTVVMWRQSLKSMLAIIWVPIIFTHLIFIGMGCASKHYLYLLPFVTVIFGYALNDIIGLTRHRSWVGIVALCCVFLFEVVSVNIIMMTPHAERSDTVTSFVPRYTPFEIRHRSLAFSVGIGGGFLVYTCDECMLATGNIVYPEFMRRYKTYIKTIRKSVIDALTVIDSDIRFLTFGDCNVGMCELMNRGYKIYAENVPFDDLPRLKIDDYNSREWLCNQNAHDIDDIYITHTQETIPLEQLAQYHTRSGRSQIEQVLLRSIISRIGNKRPVYFSALCKDFSAHFYEFELLEREGWLERAGSPWLWRVVPLSERVADGKVKGERLAE